MDKHSLSNRKTRHSICCYLTKYNAIWYNKVWSSEVNEYMVAKQGEVTQIMVPCHTINSRRDVLNLVAWLCLLNDIDEDDVAQVLAEESYTS